MMNRRRLLWPRLMQKRGWFYWSKLPSYGYAEWSHDTQADIQGIMTILRDCRTERRDFIFYADRLSTLIVEKALTLLPFEAQTIQTPTGCSYEGVVRATPVSIKTEVSSPDHT